LHIPKDVIKSPCHLQTKVVQQITHPVHTPQEGGQAHGLLVELDVGLGQIEDRAGAGLWCWPGLIPISKG